MTRPWNAHLPVPHACSSGKLGWESRQFAKRWQRKARLDKVAVKSVYRCEESGLWHMTSQPPGYARAAHRRALAKRERDGLC
jgi:hypothetical protein